MNVVALILLAGGVVLLAYLWRRRTTKAEAEKSIATVFAITPADNAKPPLPEKRTGRARRLVDVKVIITHVTRGP